MDDQAKLRWGFVDEGSGPIKQAAKAIEAMSAKMGKAELATDSLNKKMKSAPTGFEAAAKKWGVKEGSLGSTGGSPDKTKGLRANKREEEQKKTEHEVMVEEMRARKMRVRSLRFEEQRGNVYGSVLGQVGKSTALLGVGTNELAAKVGDGISGIEGVGFQMTALGGTMGSIGSKLVGLAGPVGLAVAGLGLAYEGGKLLGEAMDKTAEKEAERARYLGYRNAADQKALETTMKNTTMEENLNFQVAKRLGAIGARPTAASTPAEEEDFKSAYKKAAQELVGFGYTMEQAAAGLEKGIAGSSASLVKHAQTEFELAETERRVIAGMKVLPLNATAIQMQAHIEEVKNVVAQLVQHRTILATDAGAVTSSLLARTEQEGTIQSVIEKWQAGADAEVDMAAAVRRFAHTLPHVTQGLVLTAAQQIKYNQAVADATASYAALEGEDITLDKVMEFQKRLAVSKPPVFNFSNSRFDIKQAFAEGFDPDRIAVAFTNDLAMLGERRLQSGLAPIYAAR